MIFSGFGEIVNTSESQIKKPDDFIYDRRNAD